MVDEITDFEVPAIAVRELCIEKGCPPPWSCGGPDRCSRNSESAAIVAEVATASTIAFKLS
jgi:hypothetical protein